ncbi:response regulator transcription factor [Rhizobium sp. WL3]|uniref:response regulator transcription factor n=1 Tax=Rhizobium sp. WL3 TaxID=2603277 RepID=UPI0011C1EE32|nr:response regulator transcription factor [Rhizobium sp. WL3]QEE46538.1 response regulator transcription factor [Rhizobium sp. WL3]
MQQILVVDDEPHIRDVICFAIERAGMRPVVARSGTEAVTAFRRGRLDLVVLDVGLPDIDGLEVCREIRKTSALPILFLSARDEEIDRILGLEMGGDDYVTKPFSPRELVARIRAILKRTGNGAQASDPAGVLSVGDVVLDRAARSVAVAAHPLQLTALEFAILDALMSRPTMVFTREQLMQAAYDPGVHVSDRTIDSHIRNIRAKFAEVSGHPVVATVHGVGFRFHQADMAS